MWRDYKNWKPGVPYISRLPAFLPPKWEVCMADPSSGALPKNHDQLQPALWSGGQRMQVSWRSLNRAPQHHLVVMSVPRVVGVRTWMDPNLDQIKCRWHGNEVTRVWVLPICKCMIACPLFVDIFGLGTLLVRNVWCAVLSGTGFEKKLVFS